MSDEQQPKTPREDGQAPDGSASSSCSLPDIQERLERQKVMRERMEELGGDHSRSKPLHPVTALCRAYSMGIIDSQELHVLAADFRLATEGENLRANAKALPSSGGER